MPPAGCWPGLHTAAPCWELPTGPGPSLLLFFEDTRLLPVQQKLLRSLAGDLLKANAPKDESEIRPQTGTQGQHPRGRKGSGYHPLGWFLKRGSENIHELQHIPKAPSRGEKGSSVPWSLGRSAPPCACRCPPRGRCR